MKVGVHVKEGVLVTEGVLVKDDLAHEGGRSS